MYHILHHEKPLELTKKDCCPLYKANGHGVTVRCRFSIPKYQKETSIAARNVEKITKSNLLTSRKARRRRCCTSTCTSRRETAPSPIH